MVRLFIAGFVTLVAFVSCGLAEDERDEENKYSYISFSDKAFEAFCLENYDLNTDSRVSRYEARKVREMVCASRGIASLSEIREFARLEVLDCSGNKLLSLDLRRCTLLKRLQCGNNALQTLDIAGLRGVVSLACSRNALSTLDLSTAASLTSFEGIGNGFTTLDFVSCAGALRAEVTSNPSLKIVYARVGQSIAADGHTEVVVR